MGEWIGVDREIFVRQIFPIELRFLKGANPQIRLQGGSNIKLIHQGPIEPLDDLYLKKRYYFQALNSQPILPQVSIQTSSYQFTLPPTKLQAKPLKPPKNFSNLLAHSLKVFDYEAVQYSKRSNLVLLKMRARLANLEEFSLPFATKEGIKELNITFPTSQMVYYAIIPASMERLRFTYFNTKAKEFRAISLPIRVIDESVSTQTDIRPVEDKNKRLKVALLFAVGALFLLLAIWRRSLLLFLLALVAGGIGGTMLVPMKQVCVRAGTKIYLLPTRQSTIFEITKEPRIYEELNRIDGYTKIKLSKERVGWIADERRCQD
ncbi:MAG: hypothetical protein C6I00_01965 [Nitratiruptor sp.]|nr:hypothetical protein [Nitratiruptor sp.]NPA84055.1 hypothetical protein [Campylobacterota bacterium]